MNFKYVHLTVLRLLKKKLIIFIHFESDIMIQSSVERNRNSVKEYFYRALTDIVS